MAREKPNGLFFNIRFVLGKIDEIKRPTLATHFPTKNGGFVLTDVGANTDVKPDHLLQFAIMGSIYAKHIKNTDIINTGLLNIGVEKNKGNILTQKSYQLFEKNIKGFIGNIEPRYVFEKEVDVVVCDGFSGNIMIKLPKFEMQTMYDSETDFNLQMSPERMSKFLIHYEAFKIIKNLKGSIVECGIFKGTSFVRFALLRELFGGENSSRLIAFDVFSNSYPKTKFKENFRKY